MSGDSTISCAHCHALNAGGVDGRKRLSAWGALLGQLTRQRYLTPSLILSNSGTDGHQRCKNRPVAAVKPH
jgi:cytochrome c peroxidase